MSLKLPQFSAGSVLWEKFINLQSETLFVPKPAGCVRVVTFNAHFGKDPSAIAWLFKHNANLNQADVILLQEVEEIRGEKVSRVTKLARALKCEYIYEPARELRLRSGTHGIAILSRLPVRPLATIPLRYFELPLRHRPRIALKAEVTAGGGKVVIYNVHLDATLNHRERLAQLADVLDDAQQHDKEPVVVGGDFNTVPLLLLGRAVPVFYSNQKKKLYAYLKRRGFETRCQAAGHTLRSGIVRFQLDGIYTKRAPVIQCAVERSMRVSDHYPLWADVKIN